MSNDLRRVAIVGSIRIPFARSNGAYSALGNLEMLTACFSALVDKFGLKGETLGEVAAGAVIKHSRDWNLTREAALGSGLHPHTPAYDVQRACGTSLTTAIQLAQRIALGEIDVAIAGGVDTTSDVPVVYSPALNQIVLESARGRSLGQRLKPWLRLRPGDLKPAVPAVGEPRTGLSMGEHCELMAKEWGIGRVEQDELALQSHLKGAKAWQEGFYDDLVIPMAGLSRDNNLRPDTSLEKLAALKAVYDRSEAGTLTAGNSTPLTDGASCVLLASETWAHARGAPIQAFLMPAMLDRAGITLQDFDIYEIHEAFAAQVLCTLKAWESADYCREKLGRNAPLGTIARERMNPKGGSVALGHPFAATGTRIVGTLAKQLQERGSGSGLISICTAGGLGVTAILQR